MSNLIRASIAIGILLVSLSAAYYLIFVLPQIQRQLLDAQTKAIEWEREQQCSKTAESIFTNSSWSDANVSSGFENHFNQKLNKCFMLVRVNTSSGSSLFFYKILIDVNAGTWSSLAEYDKQVPMGVPEYAVKPFVCRMLDKYCEKDEEFDAFVKPYMEQ